MAEARKIKLKFPDRVPVIVERADGIGCGNAPDIDKNKFLIPVSHNAKCKTHTLSLSWHTLIP